MPKSTRSAMVPRSSARGGARLATRARRSVPRCPRGSSGTSTSIAPHPRRGPPHSTRRARPMNVVAGCAATTRLERLDQAVRTGGKRRIGERPARDGRASSSSRSLRSSTGSKNAARDRAMWITIGSRSSAAASHTVASRSSSGRSGSPRSSRSPSPRSFQTLIALRSRGVPTRGDPRRAGPTSRVRRASSSRGDRTSRIGPDAPGRNGRGSRSSSSPHRPSRFTIASTLHDAMSASNASDIAGAAQPPSGVSHDPRWLCASTTGEPGARHEVMRQPDGCARSVRAQRKVAQRRVERCGLQTGRSHDVTRW